MVWINLVNGLDTKKLHNFGNKVKLYNFLNENRGAKSTKEKFLNNIKSMSDIIEYYKKTDIRLYRGAPYNGEYQIINPSKHTRKSKEEGNYYTLLFDHILQKWKPYPKRSKSIIFTDDRGYAQDYGTLYIVFPFNGNKIASTMSNTSDFWYSFPQLKLNTFNGLIIELFEYYNLNTQDDEQNIFKKELIKLGEIIKKENYMGDRLSKMFLESRKKDMISFLEELYDPSGKINLFTPKTLKIQKEQELWTDGMCYLLDYYEYERIKHEIL